MTVLKSKRRESDFEVFHHYYETRKKLTDLVYRRFGYKGTTEFEKWFIDGESRIMLNRLADIQKNITMANSIYPLYIVECDERRKFQDFALGLLYDVLQELQFILEMLPNLDKNKFVIYTDMINKEIRLIKGWRQSDNKFRKYCT